MKRIYFVCFIVFICGNVFSQNYNYGLSKDDINLLLGQYIPSVEIYKYQWYEQNFSWGKQIATGSNAAIINIDYSKSSARRLGQKYENYLLIDDTSVPFVITKIEKISTNKFVLTLVLIVNLNEPPKEAGQITITFLDNIHLVIDNTNCPVSGCFNYMILWKCAGPTVTSITNKKGFLELPVFKE
jgi:hypothetical protein